MSKDFIWGLESSAWASPKNTSAHTPRSTLPPIHSEYLNCTIDEIPKRLFKLALTHFNYYQLPKAQRDKTNAQSHVLDNYHRLTDYRIGKGLHTQEFLEHRFKGRSLIVSSGHGIVEMVLSNPVSHTPNPEDVTQFMIKICDMWDWSGEENSETRPAEWLELAIKKGHTGAGLVLVDRLDHETLNTDPVTGTSFHGLTIDHKQNKIGNAIVAKLFPHDERMQKTKPETPKALPEKPPESQNSLALIKAEPEVQWNAVSIPEDSGLKKQINALLKAGEYDRIPELPRELLALYTRYGNALLGKLEASDQDLQEDIKTLKTLSERLSKKEPESEIPYKEAYLFHIRDKSRLASIWYSLMTPAQIVHEAVEQAKKELSALKAAPSLTQTFESAALAVQTSKDNNFQSGRDYKTIRQLLHKFEQEADSAITTFESTLERLLRPNAKDREILALSEQDRIELTHGVNNMLIELNALKGFIGCDLKTIETKINTKNQIDSAITNFSLAVNAAQRTAIAQTVQHGSQSANALSEASKKAFSDSMEQFQGVLAQITGEPAPQPPANQKQKFLPATNGGTFKKDTDGKIWEIDLSNMI